jgi:hypothetical protein
MKSKRQEGKTKERKLDPELMGPCGVYCGYCLTYKYNRCDGCVAMSKKATEKGEVFCPIYVCSADRGLERCVDCAEYPCGKYDSGKDGIYADSFISWIRNDIKTKGPRE